MDMADEIPGPTQRDPDITTHIITRLKALLGQPAIDAVVMFARSGVDPISQVIWLDGWQCAIQHSIDVWESILTHDKALLRQSDSKMGQPPIQGL